VSQADLAFACAWGLVDELVLGGLRHASLSPGSRSTPLALAVARHPGIEVHVHLDERSSGFFALGLAKALRRPVAVLCTSGTAAAELFPAVVEASQSRVPLLLLTADRPPHLRGTGANQTIDQVELFGSYARAYLEPPVPGVLEHPQEWRRAGVAALGASEGATPGPVHLDCPFDEPLVPEGEAVPTGDPIGRRSREDTDPRPSEADVERVAAASSGRRGIVVAGGGPTLPGAAAFLADRLGWPMIAEPTSNVRRPGLSLAAGQELLGAAWADAHRPDVVLQVGATPTTGATQRFVARADRLMVVDAHHLDPDPGRRADERVLADPDRLAEVLGDRTLEPAPAAWLDEWRLADSAARRVLDAMLDRNDAPTQLQIARDVAAAVPFGGVLFVGNSMPIRDLDQAMAPRDGLDVQANRGASGIDGLVSTALGISAAGPRPSGPGPTVALLGDLSFLHDAGAVLWNGRRGFDLTMVVVNNGGGQIFASLGQRDLPELAPLFTTPHDVDLEELCAAAGVQHARVEAAWAFGPALDHAMRHSGFQVVEVIVDPDRDRAQRAQLTDQVDASLATLAR
jgi:2-succinyl-5-enolpyruvyl-6-hydroxy-3-cyclohexene-1-carboxylate synthase